MPRVCFLFFFNDTATTEIYTLSLHDALPICAARRDRGADVRGRERRARHGVRPAPAVPGRAARGAPQPRILGPPGETDPADAGRPGEALAGARDERPGRQAGAAQASREGRVTTATIPRPDATEYAPFYGTYVGKVPDGDLLELLERQRRETQNLLAGRGGTPAAPPPAPPP